jgi:1-aminocyclopropane-1-carboxylate deaminase/D-cysteine desulfhydrase-like pyridoxal-dependent ACC family enzyme
VAGIVAGALREGLPARIVGVDVAVAPALARAMVLALARLATRADSGSAGLSRLSRALEVDGAHLGGGYGHPTRSGSEASKVALGIGLRLDPTYTAKTFARALQELQSSRSPGSRPRRVLYWHTLSAAPVEPLLEDAPTGLPRELECLLPKARSAESS